MFTISTSDIDNPPEFQTIPNHHTLNKRAKPLMFKYLKRSLYIYDDLAPMLGVRPEYPFSKIFTFVLNPMVPRIIFPQTLLWFFWFFLHLHHIAIEIPIHILHQDLVWCKSHGYHSSFIKNFLTWFQSLEEWEELCTEQMNISTQRWCTFIFRRTVMFNPEGTSYFQSNLEEYDRSPFQKYSVDFSPYLRRIQKTLFERNQIIPPELWPSLADDAPWEYFQPPTGSTSTNTLAEPDPEVDKYLDNPNPEIEFWDNEYSRTPPYYTPPSPRDFNPDNTP